MLSFARTLEERLIAAAAVHSRKTHIALVSLIAPTPRWRRIARHFRRGLQRLRRFHVLNGHEIRSYAARFIRE